MVFIPADMSVILPPPNSGEKPNLFLPSLSWQATHFSAYIRSPCAGVPLPAGRPAPSGITLISQAATSAGSIGVPRLGPSANATLMLRANTNEALSTKILCIGMADLPFGVDRPTSDRVEVLVGKRPDRCDILQLAALSYELGACGLEVPSFIPGPALKHCGATGPMPSHAETGESLRQYRLLQRRFGPTLPAIGRNHNPGDTAGAGICDTGNLVKAGLL